MNNDINVAKAIIDGKTDNNSRTFNEFSSIYKTTNECLSHKPYIEALQDRNRVLSIVGSSDQIMNAILFGSEDIIGVDISIFPNYFLFLKLVAIEVLNKNDYLEYFYGDKPFSYKTYGVIRQELPYQARKFWDSLYNEYGDKLYNSKLFNDFNVSIKRAIINNPFLQDNYYDVLKRSINRVNIELLKYDMFNAKKLDRGYFDLILLSNIINNIDIFHGESISSKEYSKRFLQAMKNYKKFLTLLPLNKEGIALTYNFSFNGKISDYFKEKEYQVNVVKENTELFNCENEILIYKKKRFNGQFR